MEGRKRGGSEEIDEETETAEEIEGVRGIIV